MFDAIQQVLSTLPSQESINTQIIDVDALIPEMDTATAQSWIQQLTDIDTQVRNGTMTWQQYHDSLDEGQRYIAQYGESTRDQIRTEEGLQQANQAARASIIAQNQAVRQSTLSFKVATIAGKAFSIALNMIAFAAIAKSISFITEKFNDLSHVTEKAEGKAKSFASSAKSSTEQIAGNRSTLEKLNEEYQKLSKGVNDLGINTGLSADQYDRYKEIMSQASSIMPDLTTRFNEQGEAIAFTKGKLSDLNEEYDRCIQKDAERFLVNGDSDGNTFQDALDNFGNNSRMGFFEELSNTVKNMFGDYDVDDVPVESMISTFKEMQNKSKDEIASFLNDIDIGPDGQYLQTESNRTKAIAQHVLDATVSEIRNMDNEAFNQLQQDIASNIESLKNNIDVDMDAITVGLLKSMHSKDAFLALGDEQRSNVSAMLSSITADAWKVIWNGKDNIKQNEVESFVGKIIESFNSNEKGFADAWQGLFSIDENIPVDEYIDKVKSFMDTICGVLGIEGEDNRIQWMISLGFDIETDEASIIGLKEKLSSLNGGAKNQDAAKWVDTLTKKELELAHSDDFINALEEQKKKLGGAALKAQDYETALDGVKSAQDGLKDTEKVTTISGILAKYDKTKDIENYNEKVSSLQSYLDKLESGTFSPVDKEALAEEFNIIADTTDKYIDKINAKIQKQKFNILSVIDEIIAKGKADGSFGDAELRKLDEYKDILRDIADVSLDKGIKFDLTGNPLENIQKLSDGLDQLDKIYADILDKEDFDWSSILNNAEFKSTFGSFTEEYENFIDTVSKSPDDINACQDAFNDLVSAYIQGTGVLDGVTEATKAGTIAILEQMGVSNAAAIVEQALINNERMLEAQKYATAHGCDDLTEATYEEINALIKEGETSEEVARYLANLALEKFKLNQMQLNTQADCDNLLSLAAHAGATKQQIDDLKNSMADLSLAKPNDFVGNAVKTGFGTMLEKMAAKSKVVRESGLYNNYTENKKKDSNARNNISETIADIEKNLRKQLEIPEFHVDYTGGTATRDTREQLAKDAEKAAKDANKEAEVAEEIIDGIAIKLDNLTEAASKATSKIDEMLSFGEKRKQTQKAIEATTKALEAEYKAMKRYAEYAQKFSADAAKETTETVTETVESSVSGSLPELASSTAADVVAEAMKYVGKLPYVWGGESLTEGADCSGFVMEIYRKFGVNMAHYTGTQYADKNSVHVSRENLQPGDIIFFKGSKGDITGNPEHVGIYAGNGQYIHSPRTGQNVSIASLSSRNDFIGAKRYPSVNPSSATSSAYTPSTTTKTYTKVVPGIDPDTLAKYQKLVREGSFDIEVITNEKLKEAIKSYQEWYEKMKSCRDKIDELNSDLRELYKTMAQIPAEKRDKNVETLDTRIDIINSKRDNLGAVIVSRDKYKSTQKDLKKARGNVRKNLRTKAQKTASGLSKTELDEINRLMKSGKSIPAKILGKIADGNLYEQCTEYNDTVYEHSRYAKTAGSASNSVRKYNELTSQILKAERAKTKQYRTAYGSTSKTYGKSLGTVRKRGNKLTKVFKKDKNGLSGPDLKRAMSCIKNRKPIPTDIMTQLPEDIYNLCVDYNDAAEKNGQFREALDNARFELQKQQQAETALRQEKKIEKHQNIADRASAKIGRNELYGENADSPKKKNKYLKDNVSLIRTQYKHLTDIARIQNDLVEMARLEAEMQQKLAEITDSRYQNISDFYSKKREWVSRDSQVLDAKGSNALTVSEKNKNLRLQTKQSVSEYKAYKQEYKDTAAEFNADRHSANKAVKHSKQLSKTLKDKIIKLVKAKKEIPESILDKVEKLDKDAFYQLDAYNRSLEWLDTASTNFSVSKQEKIQAERENKIQEHQNISDRAQSKIDRNDAFMENEVSAKNKNKYLKQDNNLLVTQYKHLIEIARLNKDNVEAARLEAEWRKKTNDNIKQQYRNLAEEHAAKMEYYQQLGDNATSAADKNINEAHRRSQMKYYYLNMRKASFDDPQEQERLDAELQSKLAESYKAVFDNVRSEYERMVSLIDNNIADLDNEIKKVTASGMLVDASYYNSKIAFENESLGRLKEEEASLKEQLKDVQMHSGAWYECQDAIQAVQNAQADSLAAVKEYKDTINEIANTIQNSMIDAFHDITEEADLLVTLLGDNLTDADLGTVTEDGLAVLSLYVSQLNICQDAAESFHKEIKSMQGALDNGTLSFIDANGIQREYASVAELKQQIKDFYASYQDEIKHVYDYESKIVDMMKQKYQSELDYLRMLIDQKEKALDLEKDLYEYSKNIKNQTDNISSLRKQIAALNGDTSNETAARIQKLQAQLKDAEDELKDTEYDRYISDQQDMLENLYDEYAKLVSDLEKNRERLLREGLDLFAKTGADVQDVIREAAESHKYEMTDEMEKVIGSIESMGHLESYFGAEGIITSSLRDILTEIHSAYTTLSSSINGLRDSVASIGHTGEYDTYGKGTASGVSNTDTPASSASTGSTGSSSSSTAPVDPPALKMPSEAEINALTNETLIRRLLENGTNKDYDPKKASSLNKYIYEKFGKALTVEEMATLSRYLGFNYTPQQLATENANHSKRKRKMLDKLKTYKFSRGGVVPKDALDLEALGFKPFSGKDTKLIGVQPKETVFNEEQTKMIRDYVEKGPDLKTVSKMTPTIGYMTDMPKIGSVRDFGTEYRFGDMTFNIAEASDLDDLMRGLQKSHEFERMFGTMVRAELTGRNRLRKFQTSFR